MSEMEDTTYFFVGHTLPKLDPNQDARTVDDDQWHYDHSRDVSLEKIPILVEHGLREDYKKEKYGNVLMSYMNKDGSKTVVAAIDCGTDDGTKVANDVHSGKFPELSIGHDSYKYKGTRTEIHGRRAAEVSLVEIGDFPDCKIIFKVPPRNFRMSSQAPETPAGTSGTTTEQEQQQQQQQQHSDSSSFNMENMDVAQLMELAKHENMSNDQLAELAAHMMRALESVTKRYDEARTQNELLTRAQYDLRAKQIKEDVENYVAQMASMGETVDPNLADRILGQSQNVPAVSEIAHTFFVHTAPVAAEMRKLREENTKLKTKNEKLKSGNSSGSFARHLRSIADRAMSKEAYVGGNGSFQRFNRDALDRAADESFDYLSRARKMAEVGSKPSTAAAPAHGQPPAPAHGSRLSADASMSVPAGTASGGQQEQPPQQPPGADLRAFSEYLQKLSSGQV